MHDPRSEFNRAVLLGLATLFCALLVSGQPPPQTCAGRCGPNQWVVACRKTVECSDCPAGTIAPPGTWSINQCRGCDPGFFCNNCDAFARAAQASMAARNALYCRQFACPPRLLEDIQSLQLDMIPSLSTSNGTSLKIVSHDHDEAEESEKEAIARRALQAGRASCQPCPRGQVQPAANQQSCYACPGGMFAFDSRSCRLCRANTFSLGGNTQCSACPPGSTQPLSGQTNCNIIPAGWFAPQGSLEARPCPAGTFQPTTGKTFCTPCPAGFFSAPGSTRCRPCAEGSFNNRQGSPTCSCCPANTFAPGIGNTNCPRCPTNTWRSYKSAPCSGGCGECQGGLQEVPNPTLATFSWNGQPRHANTIGTVKLPPKFTVSFEFYSGGAWAPCYPLAVFALEGVDRSCLHCPAVWWSSQALCILFYGGGSANFGQCGLGSGRIVGRWVTVTMQIDALAWGGITKEISGGVMPARRTGFGGTAGTPWQSGFLPTFRVMVSGSQYPAIWNSGLRNVQITAPSRQRRSLRGVEPKDWGEDVDLDGDGWADEEDEPTGIELEATHDAPSTDLELGVETFSDPAELIIAQLSRTQPATSISSVTFEGPLPDNHDERIKAATVQLLSVRKNSSENLWIYDSSENPVAMPSATLYDPLHENEDWLLREEDFAPSATLAYDWVSHSVGLNSSLHYGEAMEGDETSTSSEAQHERLLQVRRPPPPPGIPVVPPPPPPKRPATGTRECTVCNAGTYATRGGGFGGCQSCQVGYFQPATGQSNCWPCPSGWWSAQLGSTRCQICPAGQFSPGGANTACTPCVQGMVATQAGRDSCYPCPAGFFWVNAQTCTQCPVGKFGNRQGLMSCTDCPAGTFQDARVGTSCKACPAGRFQSGTSATQCTVCSAGWFCPPLSPAVAGVGTRTASMCPAGRFSSAASATTCAICPPGRFSGLGAVGCFPCIVGTASALSGQFHCPDCLAGFFSPNVAYTRCLACPVGSFQLGTAASSCTPCPASFFKGVTGPGVCLQCQPGTEGTRTGLSACARCPPGKFSPLGVGACQTCPVGMFSEGARSSCSACPPGRFAGRVGSSNCTPCPATFFAGRSSSSACQACPANRYVAHCPNPNPNPNPNR